MENVLKNWIKHVSNKDLVNVVDMYAEDGVLLGTFSDVVRKGKNDIEDYFKFFLKKNPTANLVQKETHIINDNNFTVCGFYDFEVDSGDGNRVISKARFSFVFQKQNELFKILSHHSSIMP